MKFIFTLLLALALNFITGNTSATESVIPNAYSATAGNVTFLGPLANAPRTYQFLIQASQLTDLTGKTLTGLRMRIPAGATANWPLVDVTYSNYNIYLSGSVEPSARSLTFANNVVGPQTQVRSGSLTILANSYTFGSSPNAFGTEIVFSTPWLYSGGNLLVEVRHQGFTGTSRSNDAITTSTPGYGTLVSACWTGNYTGTSGTAGNFSILKLIAGEELLTLHLNALIEGLYNVASHTMVSDTAKVYLRNSSTPFAIVDSTVSVIDAVGHSHLEFANAVNGVNYYIVVDQRNSIETWSALAQSFTGDSLEYDFTTSASQSFGNNSKQIDPAPLRFGIYSGDANKDGVVNLTDILLIANNSTNFVAGYVVTDLNGDLITNLTDLLIALNNSATFVHKITP